MWTGDLNVAHKEIDIHNPMNNLKSAGFTQAERDNFSMVIEKGGFVDVFRAQEPQAHDTCYTFWSYRFNARAKNLGWRLDYFVSSPSLIPSLGNVRVVPEFVSGACTTRISDHAALIVEVDRNRVIVE